MKRGRVVFPVAILVALLGVAGCASKANNQQIAQAVQGKIYADSNITSRQFTAAADRGVVTLGGTMSTDAERQAAAGDAAQVSGVKTVLNNLVVQTTAAAQPPAAAPAPAPAAPQGDEKKRPESGSISRACANGATGVPALQTVIAFSPRRYCNESVHCLNQSTR